MVGAAPDVVYDGQNMGVERVAVDTKTYAKKCPRIAASKFIPGSRAATVESFIGDRYPGRHVPAARCHVAIVWRAGQTHVTARDPQTNSDTNKYLVGGHTPASPGDLPHPGLRQPRCRGKGGAAPASMAKERE